MARAFRLILAGVVVIGATMGMSFAADLKLADATPGGRTTMGNSPAPKSDSPANVPAPAAATASSMATGAGPDDDMDTNAVDDISTNGMDTLDDKYKLAIGDKITYQVIEDEDDPKSIVVSDSGDIQVPYLGLYPAAGKTCKQLAKQLKVELEKKYYKQATVIISVDSMITEGVIYLVGAVRAPGPLEMPRDETLTVSKAVLRAGGFTDFADGMKVRVTRREDGTNEVFSVNVAQVLDKGRVEEVQPVESGDLIFVPEKTFNF